MEADVDVRGFVVPHDGLPDIRGRRPREPRPVATLRGKLQSRPLAVGGIETFDPAQHHLPVPPAGDVPIVARAIEIIDSTGVELVNVVASVPVIPRRATVNRSGRPFAQAT